MQQSAACRVFTASPSWRPPRVSLCLVAAVLGSRQTFESKPLLCRFRTDFSNECKNLTGLLKPVHTSCSTESRAGVQSGGSGGGRVDLLPVVTVCWVFLCISTFVCPGLMTQKQCWSFMGSFVIRVSIRLWVNVLLLFVHGGGLQVELPLGIQRLWWLFEFIRHCSSESSLRVSLFKHVTADRLTQQLE